MTLSFHESIELDLLEGADFYDRQEPGVGEYFLESILKDAEGLKQINGIHSKHFGCFRKSGSVFPFAIYYDVVEDGIVVYAILDMRQSPSWIRRELSNRRK